MVPGTATEFHLENQTSVLFVLAAMSARAPSAQFGMEIEESLSARK